MWKTVCAVLLTVIMLCSFAAAELPATYDLVYTDKNPLPAIYESVSPSVLVLVCTTTKWDEATGAVDKIDEGGGSAVYVDERGYFITNYHVVEEADELELRLSDGTAYEAFVVGYDAASDVAVLKIDEKIDAKPVAIGKSSDLRVGELVCAIGTPVDAKAMYNTLTSGIVSGLNREDADPTSERAVGLIQMDTAINPGNSGGALLNAKGELVGIPFMKYMGYYYRDEQGEEFIVYEGLSFAVPIDVAWPIAQSIIETGVYNRPRFGVSVLSIKGPEEPLKNFPPAGLQVVEIDKNGSGARAGLRVNDVITHVNGARIYDFREYTKLIDKLAEGESFTITIARYDDEKGEKLKKFEVLDVSVTLAIID